MELDSETGIQVMSAAGLTKIPKKARKCSTGSLESKSTMPINKASPLSSPSPADEKKILRKRSPIRPPGSDASQTFVFANDRPLFSGLKTEKISPPKTIRGKFERCNDYSESESEEEKESINIKNEISGDSDEEEEDTIMRPSNVRSQRFLDSDDEETPEEAKALISSGSIKRSPDSLPDFYGESSRKIKKDPDEISLDGCDIE